MTKYPMTKEVPMTNDERARLANPRSLRHSCFVIPSSLGISSFVILLAVLFPRVAAAHHILGLPHYSYKENYPQAPTLEYPATTGPYDVLMTSFPGHPVPGESTAIAFYIKDRNTGLPYAQPVSLRVLQTATFGANQVIQAPTITRTNRQPAQVFCHLSRRRRVHRGVDDGCGRNA
jgi:hypothetical protein